MFSRLSLHLVSAGAVADAAQYQPFSNPLLDRDYTGADRGDGQLFRRSGCPVKYNSCSSVGDSGVCCPETQNCALDSASHVACCPTNAVCTGTISTSGSVVTGSTFSQTTSTSSGNVIIVGGSTTTTTTSSTSGNVVTTTATGSYSGSTVANAAYPFYYIPTTYSDASACSSYYSVCVTQSAECAAYFDGQYTGMAVTISGVTGLVTVAGPSTTLDVGAASSTCSVLSESACHGLQLSQCTQTGTITGSDTATFLVSTAGAAPPRITGCHGMYAMGAGVALGVAGGLI